jgi:AcrR family transcriptional regulator
MAVVATDAHDGPGAPRGDITRRAVLDAAIDRFGRDGYRRTSVAAIARQAALGPTTTYVHYPTKEALFFAAVEDDLSSLFTMVIETLDAAEPSVGPTALIATLLAEIDAHPLAHRLVAGLEPDVTDRVLESEAVEALGRAVAERVATGQELGAIRSDVAADVLADGLISVVLALLMAAVQIGAPAIERRAAGIDAVFNTILTPQRSPVPLST